MTFPAGKLRGVALLASAALLGACTGSTDPTTASLFDNIRNINTGEYDRQIAAKEAEAAAIARSNQQRERSIASLERERSQNASVIAQLRAEIEAVRQEAAVIRGQIAGDSAKIEQLGRLETQLTAVRADVDAGVDPAVARAEVRRIRSAIRALSS